jgi:hypothetical protein
MCTGAQATKIWQIISRNIIRRCIIREYVTYIYMLANSR